MGSGSGKAGIGRWGKGRGVSHMCEEISHTLLMWEMGKVASCLGVLGVQWLFLLHLISLYGVDVLSLGKLKIFM